MNWEFFKYDYKVDYSKLIFDKAGVVIVIFLFICIVIYFIFVFLIVLFFKYIDFFLVVID